MVIEKLRENARREAAEAAAKAAAKGGNARFTGIGSVKRALPTSDIVQHHVFVPALAIWGGLLAGLCALMMVSGLTIARLAISVGLGAFASLAHIAVALTAALIGAGIAALAAKAVRARVQGISDGGMVSAPSIAAIATRRVRPIDPMAELGSESLDAPIEEIPFSRPLRDAEVDVMLQDEALALDAEGSEFPLDLLVDDDDLLELDASAEIGAEPGEVTPEDEISADVWVENTAQTATTGAGSRRVSSAGPFDPTPAERTRRSSGESECTAIADTEGGDNPREMALGEFAELPNRRGVWVTDEGENNDAPDLLKSKPQWVDEPEQEAEPKAGPQVEPAALTQPTNMPNAQPFARAHANDASTAIEKLRGVPPQELSLVQMVERFAAALHENQDSARKLSIGGHSVGATPPRDAALAEALKALALFTERGFDAGANGGLDGQPKDMVSETEQELRNALAKLQTLRGAA